MKIPQGPHIRFASMAVGLWLLARCLLGCSPTLDVVGAYQADASSISTLRLDLEVWRPESSSVQKEYRLAGRITNHGEADVSLGRLSVRYWIFYDGDVPLQGESYDSNVALYDQEGTWVTSVPGIRVTVVPLTPGVSCEGGAKANHLVTIRFPDDPPLQVPRHGGRVDCAGPEDSLGNVHREDWSSLEKQWDYSRLDELTSTADKAMDFKGVALFVDEALLAEYKDEEAPDPLTGKAPCGL